MDDNRRKRLHETLVKPVGDYTPEETEFIDAMMKGNPVRFAEVLEDEVRALRATADRLRAGSDAGITVGITPE